MRERPSVREVVGLTTAVARPGGVAPRAGQKAEVRDAVVRLAGERRR
ncbi:hypothetical protein [Arthrobacter sp. Alg241-R88]|nr:hypothetical protein [Arthrobacter sp. Alg241-R88]